MLRKIISYSLLCLALTPCLGIAKRLDVPSAPPSPNTFREYYTSGNYFKEIENKLADAKDYLDRQLQHPRQNKLAVVFDIDETALSNYQDLERLGFNHDPQALMGAHMLAGATAIPPVLALYQYATEKQVAVFFVSERPNTPEIMAATVKNLKSAGFDNWAELILRPVDKSRHSVQEFKMAARQRIAAQGYDIILNVGDQDADLNVGYAEVRVKLPNPFYKVG